MPIRQAAIRLRLDSGAFMAELRQLTSSVAATGRKWDSALGGQMNQGLNRVKQTIGGIRRALGSAMPGALMGGYAVAARVVSEAQALAKAGTIASRLEQSMYFKRLIAIKGIESGIKKEELPTFEAPILAAAHRTGASAIEMAEALEEAQTRFAKFKDFIPYMDLLGKVSIGTQSKVRDLVGMLGTGMTIFGLKGEELEDALYFMVQSASQGSISIGEFSDQLAKFFGSFKGFTKTQGMKGITEMVSFFQAIQKSLQAEPSVVGTYGRAFLNDLSRLPKKAQKQLKKAGVELTDEFGKMLPLPVLVAGFYKAREAGKFTDVTKRAVFRNVRSSAAFDALMNTLESVPKYMEEIAAASPKKGRTMVAEQYEAVMAGGMGRLQRIGVDAQIRSIRQMEVLATHEADLAEKITDLQSKFPILTEALGALKDVIIAAGVTAFLGRAIRGKAPLPIPGIPKVPIPGLPGGPKGVPTGIPKGIPTTGPVGPHPMLGPGAKGLPGAHPMLGPNVPPKLTGPGMIATLMTYVSKLVPVILALTSTSSAGEEAMTDFDKRVARLKEEGIGGIDRLLRSVQETMTGKISAEKTTEWTTILKNLGRIRSAQTALSPTAVEAGTTWFKDVFSIKLSDEEKGRIERLKKLAAVEQELKSRLDNINRGLGEMSRGMKQFSESLPMSVPGKGPPKPSNSAPGERLVGG